MHAEVVIDGTARGAALVPEAHASFHTGEEVTIGPGGRITR